MGKGLQLGFVWPVGEGSFLGKSSWGRGVNTCVPSCQSNLPPQSRQVLHKETEASQSLTSAVPAQLATPCTPHYSPAHTYLYIPPTYLQ